MLRQRLLVSSSRSENNQLRVIIVLHSPVTAKQKTAFSRYRYVAIPPDLSPPSPATKHIQNIQPALLTIPPRHLNPAPTFPRTHSARTRLVLGRCRRREPRSYKQRSGSLRNFLTASTQARTVLHTDYLLRTVYTARHVSGSISGRGTCYGMVGLGKFEDGGVV